MAKKSLSPTTALIPVPVVLVSCAGEDSRPNIITVAWAGVVCSEPPMISIALRPTRHSYRIISQSMEFVANIPSEKILRETDFCGLTTGRKIDKFKETGFTPLKAEKIKAPLIKECPVNLECKVKQKLSLGTHDLFIGEVVAFHADEDILDKGNEINISRMKPFVYTSKNGDYWNLKECIGSYGFSKGKLKHDE